MPFANKYYIADTHFGHDAIIGTCQRPYSSAAEMDEAMISAWNSVIGEHDLVYHLGDFAANLSDTSRLREVFSRLCGRKRLIVGNHDMRRGDQVHPAILGLAWDAPPTHAAESNDNGMRVHLSHYACRTWPGSYYGSVHFYGHSHGNLPPLGRSRDVGVDVSDVAFQPRTFAELTKEMLQ